MILNNIKIKGGFTMKKFDEVDEVMEEEINEMETVEVEVKEGFISKGKKFVKKNWKKIALGGTAVLAIGGVVYAATRKSDDYDMDLLTNGDELDVAEGYTLESSFVYEPAELETLEEVIETDEEV